jgi:hypothetical protein
MILNGTAESLQLVTASAGSIDVTLKYADIVSSLSAPSYTPGNQDTGVTTATTTTICAAPAASTTRHVQWCSIRNKDSANSNKVTVQKLITATVREIIQVTLAAGEELLFDGQGFSVLDPFARRKVNGSTTITNVPSIGQPWQTSDYDVRIMLNALIAEQRITNFLLSQAFGINGNMEQWRNESWFNLT